MSSNRSSCLNCDKREMGCHAVCDDYRAYKETRQQEYDRRLLESDMRNYKLAKMVRLGGRCAEY